MKSDIMHEKALDTLCQWANKRGHIVEFQTKEIDSLCYEDKTIYINTRQGVESQLYSLLHECGHLLIYLGQQGFKEEYPMYAYAATKRQEGTKKYKISVIGEEYEAWRRGRKLAKRLNIEVNKNKFDSTMARNLMTYFKWAV